MANKWRVLTSCVHGALTRAAERTPSMSFRMAAQQMGPLTLLLLLLLGEASRVVAVPRTTRQLQDKVQRPPISVDVVQVGSSTGTRTTVQVQVTFDDRAADVYAIFGDQTGHHMSFPAAFQVPQPFGTDIGPTNPAMWTVMPESRWDSFLTLGLDGPAAIPGSMSTVGIDFASWDERHALETDNGAVFFMDPEHGATTEPVVVAQLTVLGDASSVGGIFSAQGKSKRGADWEALNVRFGTMATGTRPPPPPPTFTAAPCQTCEQLGWPTEAGDIEVCAESDAGFDCAEAVPFGGARGANLMCQSLGARLCTAVELELGEGRGTGCGHDARMIWSSSWELDALTCDRATQRVVVSGSNAVAPACMGKSADNTAAVRCCADLECVAPPPPGLERVPCRSCRELGWPIENGLAEVCSESDDGFACASEVAYSGPGGATNVCQSVGARLCSSIELEAGEGQGTGCGHDNLLIWSRSTRLHDLRCAATERVVVSGNGGLAPQCQANTGTVAAVRCCADLECPDPDAPPPPPPPPGSGH